MTKIIGLTGGIGSGKTTVALYFKEKGIPVYIADEEAKKIMNSHEVVKDICNVFGTEIIDKNGLVNRKKLANIVFNNANELNKLNAIIHPKVKEHFQEWLKSHCDQDFIIKESAILFETKGNLECHKVILVTAPVEIRINRVLKRDNVTKDEILARIKNQIAEEDKRKMADYIVENIELKDTYKRIDELLKLLKDSQKNI